MYSEVIVLNDGVYVERRLKQKETWGSTIERSKKKWNI